jgi:hypothetical protein
VGVKIQLFEAGAFSFRFLSVGMDEKQSLRTKKVITRDELVAPIMNSAAFIKEESQDDLRRATRTIATRVKK